MSQWYYRQYWWGHLLNNPVYPITHFGGRLYVHFCTMLKAHQLNQVMFEEWVQGWVCVQMCVLSLQPQDSLFTWVVEVGQPGLQSYLTLRGSVIFLCLTPLFSHPFSLPTSLTPISFSFPVWPHHSSLFQWLPSLNLFPCSSFFSLLYNLAHCIFCALLD